MQTITWAPGTNSEMDDLFEDLREEQFTNYDHRYWKNYGKDSFAFAVALTICFNDDGVPEMCSSIASRDCWPPGAYRILNRLWKHTNKIKYPRRMSASFGESVKSQVAWLTQNTSFKMYFISRQTENWEQWCIDQFRDRFGLDFVDGQHKYLTCPNECDDTCWQSIIYNGDPAILEQWKRK